MWPAQIFVLHPGDTLTFQAHIAHGPEQLINLPIEILSKFIYPSGTDWVRRSNLCATFKLIFALVSGRRLALLYLFVSCGAAPCLLAVRAVVAASAPLH
ncbi:hypothetical protein [Paraburkholderia mimosarum]|uniref:hypothetical protein n=1 Tax=Paraburkholderia mimosarum TaxID=312026 RepID=UPI00047FFA17|nr:hypothetical protein [Paraburkholderia mimosarum]